MKTKKILIVEDKIDAREALERDLGILGHQTKSEATGEAALSTYKDYKPDIVFMDIQLVGEMDNGITVASYMQSHRKCCLIYCTGTPNQAKSIMETPYHEHITKPYEFDFLSDKIEIAWSRFILETQVKSKTIKLSYRDKDIGTIVESINVEEVVLIELISIDKHIKLYLDNGEIKTGGTYSNFSKFLTELNYPDFQQIRQNMAINLSFNPRLQSKYVFLDILNENAMYRVSRNYLPLLKEQLGC